MVAELRRSSELLVGSARERARQTERKRKTEREYQEYP
jgi:hypothetical protein